MDTINDGVVTMRDADAAGGPDDLQRGQGLTAWRQIADALEGEIASGLLPAEVRMPTESQLATRFGVNRHTVRRALAELAAKGLVRAARGSGTFVESRPLAYRIDARTRFSQNVARAGREGEGELIGWTEALAEPAVAASLGLDATALVLGLETRHRADGVVLSTSRSWFPLPRFAGLAEHYRGSGSITQALAASGVPDYLRRSTRIAARAASREEAALLELAPGRAVLQTDSVNVDPDGVPIQATRAVFAADRVEFVVEAP
jgi:GntR family phosphonate transport system transcriptional regulator